MSTIKEKLQDLIVNDDDFTIANVCNELASIVENWPEDEGEGIDCENCYIIEIKDQSMTIWAGGDWQNTHMIHIETDEDDELRCVKHYEAPIPQTHLSEEEVKVLLFDILPINEYLDHLAVTYSDPVSEEEFKEIFQRVESELHNIKSDNAFIGLQILSKYTNRLIIGAEHDIIYSEDLDTLIKAGILVKDAIQLRKLNWMINEGSLACFV